jgi:hypothetical protein
VFCTSIAKCKNEKNIKKVILDMSEIIFFKIDFSRDVSHNTQFKLAEKKKIRTHKEEEGMVKEKCK